MYVVVVGPLQSVICIQRKSAVSHIPQYECEPIQQWFDSYADQHDHNSFTYSSTHCQGKNAKFNNLCAKIVFIMSLILNCIRKKNQMQMCNFQIPNPNPNGSTV